MPMISRTRLLLVLLVLLVGCAPRYQTRVLDTPETRELKGHEKPYIVNGQRYDPLRSHEGFAQDGIASWYGRDFDGKPTSNGEIYDMNAMTAAHKTLPLGVFVQVTNKSNGRRTVVRVNDRGPFVQGRIIDLSYAAARELGVVEPGTAPVHIEALGYRADAPAGASAYQQPASYQIGSFTVQVGAFSRKENADRLAAALRGPFGTASIRQVWLKGQLFYRVRAGEFASLEAAEAGRERFERLGYANSFVVATE